MNKTLILKGAIATLGLAAAGLTTSLVGCSDADKPNANAEANRSGEDESATQSYAFTSTVPGADGGVTTRNAAVKWKFLPDPANSNHYTYALWIGGNYHPVTGCLSDDEIKKVIGPTVQPIRVATDETMAMSDGDPPLVVETKGARFSCVSSSNSDTPDYGDIPADQTLYIKQLDTGAQTAYFPTGVAAGQYYSFNVDDVCLAPLRDTLFKITDRRNNGWDVNSAPPDLQNEVKLGCASQATGNLSYALYLDQDPAGILPGQQVGTDCPVGDPDSTCSLNSQVLTIESKEGDRSTYLPVYRVNGKPLFVMNPETGVAVLRDDVIAFAKRLGITLAKDTVPDPFPSFWDTINAKKSGVRFWDLCAPEVTGPGGSAPSCQFKHFLYNVNGSAGGPADAGAPLPNVPRGYKDTLELEGTSFQELLDNPTLTAFDPFFPAFAECKGTMEDVFGLSRSTAAVDSRAWVDTQAALVQHNSPGVADARFHCPPSPQPNACPLALGDLSRPSVSLTLRALNNSIAAAAASCPKKVDTLNITLNSSIDVTLMPLAGVSFDRFREVNIAAAGDSAQALVFHEQCNPASPENPCKSGEFTRTRTIIPMTADYPTRTLRFNHVAMQYIPENLGGPGDAGAGDGGDAGTAAFNLSVIMIRMEGNATVGRDRVVFTDSSIAADPISQTYVSQSLQASSADIFAVRSMIGGTTNLAIFWKTIQMSDSLLVLAGTDKGIPKSPVQLLGAGGGLSYTDGKNDVFAVNAVIQGPILANTGSKAIFYDTMLQRSTGKEAIHFAGTDTAPPASPQMDWFRNSSVTNLQKTSKVPFIIYEPSSVPTGPLAQFRGTVKFWDPNASQPSNQVVPNPANTSEWKRVSWCKGIGTLKVLSGALPNQVVCPVVDAGAAH